MTLSDYGKYLAAKKSVDDRALNADVLACLRARLHACGERELRVLEIGAGLGTMPARLIELGVLGRADYTLLDADAGLLAESRDWLRDWAARSGHHARAEQHAIRIDERVLVRCVHGDIGELVRSTADRGRYDVLIANAVLDLVDVPSVLPQLLALLVAGGTYWFSINFDGETIFSPEHEHDEELLRVYHRSMDERRCDGRPAGDSRTGRHLFRHLREAGASILRAGSSDWVVHAERGYYPHAESDFLRFILRTIDEELQRHAGVDRGTLARWVATRHAQVDRGELVYVAHQLDFVGVLEAERSPVVRI